MAPELTNFLSATAALALYLFVQPYAPYVIGTGIGVWSWGTAKNRTAIEEIGRGLFFGLLSGGTAWLVQQLVIGGAA